MAAFSTRTGPIRAPRGPSIVLWAILDHVVCMRSCYAPGAEFRIDVSRLWGRVSSYDDIPALFYVPVQPATGNLQEVQFFVFTSYLSEPVHFQFHRWREAYKLVLTVIRNRLYSPVELVNAKAITCA